MSNPQYTYALSGLQRKREELIKQRKALQSALKQTEENVRLVTAAIKLFDPDTHQEVIKSGRFARGEAIKTRRITLDALRESGGRLITSRELADAYMAKHGIESSVLNRKTYGQRFAACLQSLNRAGMLTQERVSGRAVGWRLKPDA